MEGRCHDGNKTKINFAADLEQVQLPDTAPELLPEEECNGYVRRRARGAKTDAQCVNEVCALVAQGLTLKTALRVVGVPQVTWYMWRQDNVAQLLEKFEFANVCNLDGMADDVSRQLAYCSRVRARRARHGVLVVGEEAKGLVDCNFLPGSARRLELGCSRHIAPLLLALRSRADSVAHIPKFFRPFEEPPFSALSLLVRSRSIEKAVQLRGSQIESRRSSFLGSRLDRLRYCERLLEKTANGFRTGQLSILTRNPSIQTRKLGRLYAYQDRLALTRCGRSPFLRS
jgi:hypothetical protein